MTAAFHSKFDIEYVGCGPCAHTPKAQQASASWILSTVAGIDLNDDILEIVLWRLNDMGAIPTMVSDQWVAVIAEGQIAGKTIKTRIQGDSFRIAAVETYRWWREKHKELTGKDPEGES